MLTSEHIDAIGGALAKAQAELSNPPKNKTNPHFNSKYVDLSDGMDVIRKCLGKHQIAVVQATKSEEGIIILHTRLLHSSGQWIESTYPVCGLDTHQKMGSALTYARRYAIFAMVGVAGEDDDDGNSAAVAKAAPKKAAPKVEVKTSPAPAESPVSASNQMEVGLTPEASEEVLNDMLDSLIACESRADLQAWAEVNKSKKGQLLPAHQKEVLEAFKEKDAELKSNG